LHSFHLWHSISSALSCEPTTAGLIRNQLRPAPSLGLTARVELHCAPPGMSRMNATQSPSLA
jgi:hypothetical protein